MIRHKLVLLDFDGTVANTLENVWACMCSTLKEFGCQAPSKELIRETMGLPLEDVMLKLTCKSLGDLEISKMVMRYRSLYTREITQTVLYPGISSALRAMKQAGVELALISNKGRDAIQRSLFYAGIDDSFTLIIGGDSSIYRKPDPRLYYEQIKPLFPDLDNEEVLVIGDTSTDIHFGHNAGLQVCWASYGYGKTEECLMMAPKFTIAAPEQILGILSL